jgi:hypothetical protein
LPYFHSGHWLILDLTAINPIDQVTDFAKNDRLSPLIQGAGGIQVRPLASRTGLSWRKADHVS